MDKASTRAKCQEGGSVFCFVFSYQVSCNVGLWLSHVVKIVLELVSYWLLSEMYVASLMDPGLDQSALWCFGVSCSLLTVDVKSCTLLSMVATAFCCYDARNLHSLWLNGLSSEPKTYSDNSKVARHNTLHTKVACNMIKSAQLMAEEPNVKYKGGFYG